MLVSEPPVMGDLAPLDDVPNYRDDWCVVQVAELRAFALVSDKLLPVTAGRGAYDIIMQDIADAAGRGGTAFTLWDTERAIEKLTIGHFKPERTPAGMVVQVARLHCRESAKL